MWILWWTVRWMMRLSLLSKLSNTPVLKYIPYTSTYRPHNNKLNACRQCRHVGADMPTVPTCRADNADSADSSDKCRHICRRVGSVGTVGSKCRHNNWQLGLPSTFPNSSPLSLKHGLPPTLATLDPYLACLHHMLGLLFPESSAMMIVIGIYNLHCIKWYVYVTIRRNKAFYWPHIQCPPFDMIGMSLYDVATTEVKVRYRSLYKRKMCAVLCKENTEPLTKRMGHVSLHIIQKSDTWFITYIGMFMVWGNASSRKRSSQYVLNHFENCYTLDYGMDHTWNGCFMYMAYSFVTSDETRLWMWRHSTIISFVHG